jgi:hypothetical protein
MKRSTAFTTKPRLQRCSTAGRTLLLLITFTVACFAFAPVANGQAPPGALWYNGDFTGDGWQTDNNIGAGCSFLSQVYDDFTVMPPFGWNVTEVFSDDILVDCPDYPQIIGAVWEIRQGVSAGNPGVLIAQGFTVTPAVTATGRSWNPYGIEFFEYRVEVQGLNVFLSPSTYHLNVTPILNGQGVTVDSSTTGTNCVGTPCGNNGNAFQNAPNNYYWQPISGDFAMGVVGNSNNNPQLVEGGSRKTGWEIPLPINGLSGIEDRSGQPGGTYTITMTFNENIASVARASASCGKVASTSIDGATLTINLTKVSCNASHITVTANDVKDSAGINLDDACLTVGLLLGDVNGDGLVDSADLDIVNSQIGQPTNGENFRSDINTDGVISAADARVVTQQQGTHLP